MTRFDKWLAVALLALAVFNAGDYFFTLRAVGEFGIPEANPYMDALIGTPWFFLVKMVFVPLGILLIWWTRHRVRRSVFMLLGVVVLAYAWVTVYHLVHQLRIITGS